MAEHRVHWWEDELPSGPVVFWRARPDKREVRYVPEHAQHECVPERERLVRVAERLGRLDADELMRWAELYGHPESWAKRAMELHTENERLRKALRDLEQRNQGAG